MNSAAPRRRVQRLERVADHMRVEVTALAGVDLDRRRAGRPDALGVVRGLLVAFDHRDRQPALQRLDRLDEQGRLARAGARDDVEREQPPGGEARAVVAGEGVVLGQNVPFDPDHALLAHARRMRAIVLDVIVRMIASMRMIMIALLVADVVMMMADGYAARARRRDREHARALATSLHRTVLKLVEHHLRLNAPANAAHRAISISGTFTPSRQANRAKAPTHHAHGEARLVPRPIMRHRHRLSTGALSQLRRGETGAASQAFAFFDPSSSLSQT